MMSDSKDTKKDVFDEKSDNRPNRQGADKEPNEPYNVETDPLRFHPEKADLKDSPSKDSSESDKSE